MNEKEKFEVRRANYIGTTYKVVEEVIKVLEKEEKPSFLDFSSLMSKIDNANINTGCKMALYRYVYNAMSYYGNAEVLSVIKFSLEKFDILVNISVGNYDENMEKLGLKKIQTQFKEQNKEEYFFFILHIILCGMSVNLNGFEEDKKKPIFPMECFDWCTPF